MLSRVSREEFVPTRWSLVRDAAGADSERARVALATLCQAYWYPLYAFVRRKGVPAGEAEDVVQGFFARLLEKRDLAGVARENGRFRSFLAASIQHYLANLRDHERAEKRGGGRVRLDVDFAGADTRFALEAPDGDPLQAFERGWAVELLRRALEGLEQEYRATNRGELFDVLRGAITDGERAPVAEYARRLGSTEKAVKVAVHRLRVRYRERLRAEIAETVTGEAEVEAEIGALFRAFSA
jgi:RNA polymerase sigma factor (sigma-70 family)